MKPLHKQCIKTAINSYLFQPNDDTTRMQIQSQVTSVLNDGTYYDYKVVCDNTNNTPSDIANGMLNVDIYTKVIGSINISHTKVTAGGSTISLPTENMLTYKEYLALSNE